MALPNVTAAVLRWATPHNIKTIAKHTVDFVDQNVVTSREIRAVVQPAEKDKLNVEQLDWSRQYLTVHSPDPIANGELLEYNGEDFKIIDNGDWQAFGYTEAVAEQTKKAIVQVTP